MWELRTNSDAHMLDSALTFWVCTPPGLISLAHQLICGKKFGQFIVIYSNIGILRTPTKDSTSRYTLVRT